MASAPRCSNFDLAPDDYLLIGAGERFRNADGDDRQEELARCVAGEPIELMREPGNPRDPMAVALLSCRGVQVGYLARADAGWLAPLLDGGGMASATVERVAPRGRPFAPLAMTVRLSLRPASLHAPGCPGQASRS